MFRFQPGRAFAFLCTGFIVGIACASWSVSWWAMIGAVCGVLGFWCVRYPGIRKDLASVCLLFVLSVTSSLFGFLQYHHAQSSEDSLFFVAEGKKMTIEGTIVRTEETEQGPRFTLSDLVVDGIKKEDRLLVRVPFFSLGDVGERVSISCAPKRPEPFDDFAYDRYLAAKDIVATCTSRGTPFVLSKDESAWIRILSVMNTVHIFFVQAIDTVLPDPHAQLLAGLLLGDDAFSDTWKTRFLRTGTSHIVAASGSNVALVVSLVLGFLFGLGIHRRVATAFALFGIFSFVILAGGESAVLRAGIMASFVVLGRFVGRASSVRNILLFTVCIMLFCEPRLLRDDIGFQLSVLSTVGLLMWAKSFESHVAFIPERFGLREGFATTLAATCATLPVTAFGMGQFSLVGPFANLLVLPLLPSAMALGSFALVVGLVSAPLGRWVAFPVWWILDVVLFVLRELSSLSFAYAHVSRKELCMVLCGALLIFLFLRKRMKRSQKKDDHSKQKGFFLVLFLFILLFFSSFVQHVFRDGWFSSSVRVWVFDVGQGDAIFIDTPEKDVVIDGGPSFRMREKVGMVLPWFDRDIENVFATHPHADHIVGLVPLLEQYRALEVGISGQGCTSLECKSFLYAAPQAHAIEQGYEVTLAPHVTLRALWPEKDYGKERLQDPNSGSLVFLLSTPYGSMLLTGDAGIDQESSLLPLIPDHVDVLKVGHHGSRTATSDALLEALRPSTAIISLGKENDFGHPHQEVLDRLAFFHVQTWRTDLLGDIRVEFSLQGIHATAWSL